MDHHEYSKDYKKYKKNFDKAIKCYQEAQKIPKKCFKNNSNDENSNDDASYNDYAFLGEVLMYSNELYNLTKSEEMPKKNKEIIALKDLLPKYETRIVEIIELFERYTEEGKIYLYTTY